MQTWRTWLPPQAVGLDCQLNFLRKSFFFNPGAGFPHPSPTGCGFHDALLLSPTGCGFRDVLLPSPIGCGFRDVLFPPPTRCGFHDALPPSPAGCGFHDVLLPYHTRCGFHGALLPCNNYCKVYLYHVHKLGSSDLCEDLTSILQQLIWIHLKYLLLRLCTTCHY